MSVQETEEGVEILHLDDSKANSMSVSMYTASTRSSLSHSHCNSYPASSLKSNHSQTCSLTDFSYQSAENNSFELEYSDEDLSIISSNDREEEYEESKTRDVNDDLFDLELPSIRTLDLVIDEMPAIHSKAFVTSKTKNEGVLRSSNNYCKPASTDEREKVMACPCCNSYVNCEHRTKKDNRFPIPSSPSSMRKSQGSASKSNPGSVFTSFVDGLWPNQQHKDLDEPSDKHTSSAVKSMGYTVKRRLMEDWLDKKGTGNDMFRSTNWKPRWCSLVMATIPDWEQEVPLLLVSWSCTTNPTNVIILDSSIAISVDQNTTSNANEYNNNSCCFDIVSRKEHNNGQQSKLSNGKLTKTFSATLEQRDGWVSKINESIRMYEKSKINRQKEEGLLPPTSPIRTKSGRRLRDNGLSGLSIAC